MKKVFSVLLIACLTLMLTACGCDHSWKEADCETPKTCEKCGATEGEALGHEADAPEEEAMDFEKAVYREVTRCRRCGAVLEEKEVSAETFFRDGSFLLSYNDFAKRFDQVFRGIGKDVWHVDTAENEGQAVCLLKQKDTVCAVLVFSAGDQIITVDQKDARNINRVSCLCVPQLQGNAVADVISGLLETCDPTLDEKTEQELFGEISSQMQANQSPLFLLKHKGLVLGSAPGVEANATDFHMTLE